MGIFHKSQGQIIRKVFDDFNDAIRVIYHREDREVQKILLLKEIVKELKIINLHLSEMSENEINETD